MVNKTHRINVTFPLAVFEKIQERANDIGTKPGDLCRQYVLDKLDNNGNDKTNISKRDVLNILIVSLLFGAVLSLTTIYMILRYAI